MVSLLRNESQYSQFELFLDFLLTLLVLFYFIFCYRQLQKDRSGSLAYVDKVLCLLALGQTILELLYYLVLDYDLVLTTIRCLGLGMQTLICNILAQIITNEQQQPVIWIIAKGWMSLVFMEWFWAGLAHQSILDYNCVQIDYLILSLTGLVLALGAFYMGQEALGVIKQYQEQQEQQYNSGHNSKVLQQKIDYIKNRLEQIFYLNGCGLIQFGLQFGWDCFARYKSEISADCAIYYHASNFGLVFVFVILKFLSLLTIPVTLYIVFYEKNKHQFRFEEYDDVASFEMQANS